MTPARGLSFLVFLAVLAVLAAVYALSNGSVAFDFSALSSMLNSNGEDTPNQLQQQVLLEVRMPRIALAFAVGALLAVAGVLMQALLRNPLADPYVLGLSGGAASGALLALLLRLPLWGQQLASWSGAALSMALVLWLARDASGRSATRFLLTGVVLAAGWGALISFVLAITPDAGLRGMLFWLMGDLSIPQSAALPWWALLLGLPLAWLLARPLDVLTQGELSARSVGISVARLHLVLFVLASLLTAAAVSVAGPIGFVGLVVPHLLRLAGARHHRILLPASALAGGTLLLLADTVARTAFAPQQLPVGVLTAALGVPLFLWLLQRSR